MSSGWLQSALHWQWPWWMTAKLRTTFLKPHLVFIGFLDTILSTLLAVQHLDLSRAVAILRCLPLQVRPGLYYSVTDGPVAVRDAKSDFKIIQSGPSSYGECWDQMGWRYAVATLWWILPTFDGATGVKFVASVNRALLFWVAIEAHSSSYWLENLSASSSIPKPSRQTANHVTKQHSYSTVILVWLEKYLITDNCLFT